MRRWLKRPGNKFTALLLSTAAGVLMGMLLYAFWPVITS